jgi:hypothetical protein
MATKYQSSGVGRRETVSRVLNSEWPAQSRERSAKVLKVRGILYAMWPEAVGLGQKDEEKHRIVSQW